MDKRHFAAALGLFASAAFADTITTDLGVVIDGVVTELPDGNYRVIAGDNELIYQKSEVVNLEKNDRNGHLDMEEVARETAKADAELTDKTGLNQSQRARVDALLPELMQDGDAHTKARDAIVAMAAECDIYRYMEFLFETSTPLLQLHLLDVMLQLNPPKALPRMREALLSNHAGVREVAIQLLSVANDAEAAPMIARGLVDHEMNVQISAAYALANLNYRAATPALIECLPHPDLRVAGAAKEALVKLWQDTIGDVRPVNVAEWTAVWEDKKSAVSGPMKLGDLAPLSDPEKPFVNG